MEYASLSKANAALTTGIIGTAGTGLGLLSNLLGLNGCGCAAQASAHGCSEDHHVTRYDAAKDAEIARLTTEISLRDASTFTMNEMNKLRNYVDGKFDAVNAQLCSQAVVNAQVTANLSCMQGQIAVLNGLTKTIIPASSICPPVMPEFNSWTAPTAGA